MYAYKMSKCLASYFVQVYRKETKAKIKAIGTGARLTCNQNKENAKPYERE